MGPDEAADYKFTNAIIIAETGKTLPALFGF